MEQTIMTLYSGATVRTIHFHVRTTGCVIDTQYLVIRVCISSVEKLAGFHISFTNRQHSAMKETSWVFRSREQIVRHAVSIMVLHLNQPHITRSAQRPGPAKLKFGMWMNHMCRRI